MEGSWVSARNSICEPISIMQVLKIALLCSVDDECISNCLSNSESCQDDIIAMFFTNVVLKYWKTTMFVASSWINWYFFMNRMQMQFNLSYSCSWNPAELTRSRPIVHYTSYTRGILMRITTIGATQIVSNSLNMEAGHESANVSYGIYD
jgi:hypothetical protein